VKLILKKLVLWIFALVFLAVIYDFGLGIWGSFPPRRPANVSRSAVFIFGLPVGSPIPLQKKGTWVDCWLDKEHSINLCREVWVDGTLIYEGPFIPLEGNGPLPQDRLQINTKVISDLDIFQGERIQIIHLRNGTILIPAEDAENARRQALYWLRYNRRD
jgi:hypothetical protein